MIRISEYVSFRSANTVPEEGTSAVVNSKAERSAKNRKYLFRNNFEMELYTKNVECEEERELYLK